VILDISKDRQVNGPNFQLLQEIADEAFMPLAYGGGIRNVEEGLRILRIGFEKLVFNSAIEESPKIIKELIKLVGGQSIVLSLDYRTKFGISILYKNSGKIKSRLSFTEIIKTYENLGVGEIIIHSIERDGTRSGYDVSLLSKIAKETTLPVIALGGCNGLPDIKKLMNQSDVSAFAAGHLFVFYGQRNGILINFPTESDFYNIGIYHD
jgi:cyclase